MEGQKLSNRSRLGERQGPWLSHSLTQSLTHSFSKENAGAGAVHCQFTFQTLHVTSQDGSSLAFLAAAAGKECNIQDARGRGLWICAAIFGSGSWVTLYLDSKIAFWLCGLNSIEELYMCYSLKFYRNIIGKKFITIWPFLYNIFKNFFVKDDLNLEYKFLINCFCSPSLSV